METDVPAKACEALGSHSLSSSPPHLSHPGLLIVPVFHTLAELPHGFVFTILSTCSSVPSHGFPLPSPPASPGSNAVISGNCSLITLFHFVFPNPCPPLCFSISICCLLKPSVFHLFILFIVCLPQEVKLHWCRNFHLFCTLTRVRSWESYVASMPQFPHL